MKVLLPALQLVHCVKYARIQLFSNLDTECLILSLYGNIRVRENLYSRICDALHYLLPFVQFEKREKHPWKTFTFGKVAG